MTPSAYGAAESWPADRAAAPVQGDPSAARSDNLEFDLLAQDATAPTYPWAPDDDLAPDDWGPPSEDGEVPMDGTAVDDQRSSGWQRVSAFETAGGLSSRGVIALSGIAAFGCAGLDLALTGGRITFFFDLCFVVICLVTTMAVRRSDLFTAGVLPPLLFAAVIAVLALAAPHAFESAPGVNKVFLTGLANHAAGLVFGYAAALVTVAARMASSRNQRL